MEAPSTKPRDYDRKQRLYPTTVRVIHWLATHDQGTISDMSRSLHLSASAVADAVKFLHESGVIYIKEWHRHNGPHIKEWALGKGSDALPRRPLTAAEKSAAWRERGGDQHRARDLIREQKKIQKSMTMAGMLGL